MKRLGFGSDILEFSRCHRGLISPEKQGVNRNRFSSFPDIQTGSRLTCVIVVTCSVSSKKRDRYPD